MPRLMQNEKSKNDEIEQEKKKILETFENQVCDLTKKIEEGEKYRTRSVFPTVSSVITKYHKELVHEIDKYKAEHKIKSHNGQLLSSVGPYTELENMMIYQGQAVCDEKSGINTKNGWGRALFCNASYYEGNWLDDKREGFGVEIKPSGKFLFLKKKVRTRLDSGNRIN